MYILEIILLILIFFIFVSSVVLGSLVINIYLQCYSFISTLIRSQTDICLRVFRNPAYAKASYCQGCHSALRLNKNVESKAVELLQAIPKPFLSLHLRFEPDMVAYSR